MSETSVIRAYESENLAKQYEKYRPQHQTSIRDLIIENLRERQSLPDEEDKTKFGQMLDVACGGGQFTFMFKAYFDSILGIDISSGQIAVANARKSSQIQFRVVHDNFFPVDDGIVDLVTCAVAIHYLDLEIFVKECLRVLKPNGCVAIYTYFPSGLRYKCVVDGCETVAENYREYGDLIRKFYNDCKAYPRNKIWMDGCEKLFEMIPVESKRWIQTNPHYKDYTLQELMMFWKTVGEYHHLPEEIKEKYDPLEEFKLGIKKLINKEEEKDEDINLQMVYKLPLILFTL